MQVHNFTTVNKTPESRERERECISILNSSHMSYWQVLESPQVHLQKSHICPLSLFHHHFPPEQASWTTAQTPNPTQPDPPTPTLRVGPWPSGGVVGVPIWWPILGVLTNGSLWWNWPLGAGNLQKQQRGRLGWKFTHQWELTFLGLIFWGETSF